MTQKRKLLLTFFTGILLGCTLALIFLPVLNRELSFRAATKEQSRLALQQAQLLEAVRISNLTPLMSSVLEQANAESNTFPGGALSEETVARIAALSHALQPYAIMEGDSLAEKKLSPERGLLLLALHQMDIDTASMQKILSRATFAGADLRRASLKGALLQSADLQGANLHEANLQGANLKEANLKSADLWSANLNGATLEGTELRRADLRWAELNGAILDSAFLDGADLSSAKLRNASLKGASFTWGKMSGALLNAAKMTSMDLDGTDMSRSILDRADLKGANVARAILNEASMVEVELEHATFLTNNWFDLLSAWRVTGVEAILQGYQMVRDSSGRRDFVLVKTSGAAP